jgi:hypothetical protein
MFFTIRSDGDFGCTDFSLISHSLVVTMSQKSSVPQPVNSVSQALMSDTPSIAGSLLISWRWNSRCSDDRVK